MNRCLHITVRGRVQGVSFRFHTQKQAIKLNIRGFVRNLAEGDVEIVACGEPGALQQLVAWCHSGPTPARVSAVIVNPNPHHGGEFLNGFEIR